MSKFNEGDRVVITESNLTEYVGEKATVTGLSDIDGAVNIRLDDPSILSSWVHLDDGAMPWMEEWLDKE